ncbi:MAG TPA: hypothetical protein VN442_24800 [Bryobacteraceae bacterium]|nr:hypothetical protein [Bryobacteraceae bacterium]
MEPNGFGVVATGLMAAVTFPLAFGIARLCLNGVLHVIHGGRRH